MHKHWIYFHKIHYKLFATILIYNKNKYIAKNVFATITWNFCSVYSNPNQNFIVQDNYYVAVHNCKNIYIYILFNQNGKENIYCS